MEQDIKVYRNDKLIYTVKGIVGGSEGVVLPPNTDVDIHVDDVLSDGQNELIVSFVYMVGTKDSIWNLGTEKYSDYLEKHKSQKPSVVNNVTSDNFMQNVGDYGKITLKQQQSYSVDDLYNLIAKIEDSKDKASTAELASEMQKVSSDDSKPKKGFLNRFDKLIAKYPNISKIVSGLLVQWATN